MSLNSSKSLQIRDLKENPEKSTSRNIMAYFRTNVLKKRQIEGIPEVTSTINAVRVVPPQ